MEQRKLTEIAESVFGKVGADNSVVDIQPVVVSWAADAAIANARLQAERVRQAGNANPQAETGYRRMAERVSRSTTTAAETRRNARRAAASLSTMGTHRVARDTFRITPVVDPEVEGEIDFLADELIANETDVET